MQKLTEMEANELGGPESREVLLKPAIESRELRRKEQGKNERLAYAVRIENETKRKGVLLSYKHLKESKTKGMVVISFEMLF